MLIFILLNSFSNKTCKQTPIIILVKSEKSKQQQKIYFRKTMSNYMFVIKTYFSLLICKKIPSFKLQLSSVLE